MATSQGIENITFVTWKWKGLDESRVFLSEHVNVLYSMLKRHCHQSFSLVCVTDDSSGLDPDIEHFPMPKTPFDNLMTPHGNANKVFPSCYRRLWMFSKEATILGPRVFLLDIDVIITGSLEPLLRKRADFVGWVDARFGWSKIAGGAWILNTGSHPEVWEQFDPKTSPLKAFEAGMRGSDQAWISYMLYPPRQSFGERDGVVKLGWIRKGGREVPPGIRMIFFAGNLPPWHPQIQLGHAWVKDYWR